MRWTRSRLRPEGGFTLIELLVVVLILGILIAVSAPAFLSQTQKAQDSASKQYLAIALKAARSDAVDNPAGQGLYRTGSTLASAIQASEPELTVQAAASACPSTANGNTSLTDTTPSHIWIDTTQSSATTLVMCNDPTHSVWTVTADQHSAPVFTVVRNVSYTSGSGSSSATYASQVAADGAVAYWRLGESSGTTAVDSKGLQNGTYISAVTLGSAGAILSDTDTAVTIGSGGKVDLGQNTAYNDTHAFTWEFWFKPPTGLADWTGLMGDDNGLSPGAGMHFGLRSTGAVAFQIGDGASGGPYIDSGSVHVTYNAWNYAVATYDGTTLKLYLNSAQVATVSTGTHAAATVPLTLGGRPVGASGGVSATSAVGTVFDDAAVYPTALSTSTISAHYALAQSAQSSGPSVSMDNAGFEASAPGTVPSGWTFTYTATPGGACTAGATTTSLPAGGLTGNYCLGTTAHGGSQTLYMRTAGSAPSNGTGVFALSPAFTSAGGNLTFWAKFEGAPAPTGCAIITVDVTDGSGTVLRTPISAQAVPVSWTQYTVPMSGDSGQQRRIRLFETTTPSVSGCTGYGPGVWFDDIVAG